MGEAEEFADFVSRRWARFVKAAVLLGNGVPEAEDLAQTAFVKCFVAWPRVRDAQDRDGYAYRILLNCHRDAHRRRWWGERPTAELPDAVSPDASVSSDVTVDVERALSRLTPAHREAVVLRYFAHLSEQEMARALGVAPGTVKSRLARALRELAGDPTLQDLADGRTP